MQNLPTELSPHVENMLPGLWFPPGMTDRSGTACEISSVTRRLSFGSHPTGYHRSLP